MTIGTINVFERERKRGEGEREREREGETKRERETEGRNPYIEMAIGAINVNSLMPNINNLQVSLR